MKTLFKKSPVKDKKKDVCIETLYADQVIDFSSQYQADFSGNSYRVKNAAGLPTQYPEYGSSPDAAVFRTYGPWWKQAPSGQHEIGKKNPRFNAEDFIDLYYTKALYPTEVIIYETFSPGAVVRVLACDKSLFDGKKSESPCRWEILWEGENHSACHEARKFVCQSKKIGFKTCYIRVEFNSTLCGHYTEVDAVSLSGYDSLPDSEEKLTQFKHTPLFGKELIYGSEEKLIHQLDHFSVLGKKLVYGREATEEEIENSGLFKLVPAEILLHLLSYLDLTVFALLSRSCKYFWKLCGDPSFYKSLNLKSYWPNVTDATFMALQQRCSMLEELDLSWCGPLGMVTADAFYRFLSQLDGNLKVLRLAACNFLDLDSLSVITEHCRNLIELDLQSCFVDNCYAEVVFPLLSSLSELTRLNLARIQIGDKFLIPIFNSCTKLQHINLGGNRSIKCLNDVLEAITNSCPELRSLDLWRMRNVLEATGLLLLRRCRNLEELDFGWCTLINNNDCLQEVAKHCKNLKKVFLAACREVTSQDVIAFSNCPLMEQIDLWGSGQISKNSIDILLERCEKLTLVDLTDCPKIRREHVIEWQTKYPNVYIKKRSFP